MQRVSTTPTHEFETLIEPRIGSAEVATAAASNIYNTIRERRNEIYRESHSPRIWRFF